MKKIATILLIFFLTLTSHTQNYLVHFDRNGGDAGTMSPQEFEYGVPQNIFLNNFSKNNYTFIGWADTGIGNAIYEDGQEIVINKNTTLYAKWELNTYQLTFYANGGNGEMLPQLFTHGELQRLTSNNFSRLGHIFKGWTPSPTGDVVYNDEDYISLTDHSSLYAQWTEISFTLTLDPNEGEVTPTTLEVVFNQPIGLMPIPTRFGFYFNGWELEEEIINEETIWIYDEDKIAEALWSRNIFLVSFDSNGGTDGEMESQTFSHEIPQQLSKNLFTKIGYDFLGWATSPLGLPEFDDQAVITISEDFTLYAIWVSKIFNITFDPNGGEVDPAIINVTYNQPFGTLPNPTKIGHIFEGWFTELNGEGTQMTEDSIFTKLEDITLFAKWTKKIYQVSFDANDGIGTMNNQYFTFAVAQNLSPNLFTKEGFIYKGWAISQDGDLHFNDQQLVIIDSNTTLYAVWALPEIVEVSFNSNGGFGTMSPQNFTQNVPQNLSLNNFTRTGWSFTGWGLTPNGNVAYKDVETLTTLTPLTLYALWVEGEGTIFNPYLIKTVSDLKWLSNNVMNSVSTSGKFYRMMNDIDMQGIADFIPIGGFSNPAINSNAIRFFGSFDGYGFSVKNLNILKPALNNVALFGYVGSGALVTNLGVSGSFTGLNNVASLIAVNVSGSVSNCFANGSITSTATTGFNYTGGLIATNNGGSINNCFAICEVTGATIGGFIGYNYNNGTISNSYSVPQKIISTSTHGAFIGNFSGTISNSYYATTLGINPLGNGSSAGIFGKANSEFLAPEIVGLLNTAQNPHPWAQDISNINGGYPIIKAAYIVTFNANTGVGTISNQTFIKNEFQNIKSNTFTKTGYTFLGWATSASGNVAYQDAENITINTNLNLFAKWEINTYTLTLNTNGGIGAPATITVTYNANIGASLVNPTRTGYTFNGWFIGATPITSATVWTYLANQTANANWTANTFTLTYSYAGATGGNTDVSKTVTYDQAIGILPTPTRTGYTFTGWSIGATPINAAFIWNYTTNQTTTAQWTVNTYTLTFDYQGATSGNSELTRTVTYNVAIGALPTPLRTGYTFGGWKISGTTITGATVWNYLSNQTAVAQWAANTFTLTLYPNGGNVSPTTLSVTYDQPIGVIPTPTRTGYSLTNWQIGTTNIIASTVWNYLENQTAVAHWAANSYTLTFNPTGGAVFPTSKTVFYDAEFGTLPTPTKSGYTFFAWKIGYNYISSNDIWGFTSNQTAEAEWVANRYTLTFNPNLGTVNPTSVQIEFGTEINFLPTPSRTGYTFVVWKIDEIPISETTVWNFASNKTAFAEWTANTYTLTFNPNGGSVSPQSKLVTYNTQIGTLPIPTRNGYAFTGWRIGATSITATTIWNFIPDQVADAQWTVNSYTLSFNLNGGSGSANPKTVIYDAPIGTLPNPSRVGYTFDGWKIDETIITTATIWNYIENKAAVAQWTANSYILTFNPNGGMVNPTSKNVIYDSEIGSIPTPTKNGYTFISWKIDEIIVTESTLWNYVSNKEAIAQWAVNSYTLTLNPNGGSVNPALLNVTYDAAIGTLPIPTKTGYTFLRWQIGITTITESTIWNYTTNQIAMAHWVVNSYTLTLNPNGGVVVPTSITVYFDAAIGTIPTPSWTGYIFLGWKVDDVLITESTNWSYLTNKTAVAQWNVNTYILTLNPNGGNVSLTTIDVIYDTAIGTIPNPTRTGYTFLGWKIDETTINENTIWHYLSNQIAVAQWIVNNYTLTLNPNGGTVTPSSLLITYDSAIGAIPTPTRTGYTFLGWKINETTITESTIWNYLSDTTAVANWSVNTYILTLNPNGGTVTPTYLNVTYNMAIGAIPTPTRTGYTFLGWKIDEIIVTEDTIWHYLTNKTALAQWSVNTYTLTLNPNGGTVTPSILPVYYDAAIGSIPTPSRTGYTFSGWKINEITINESTIWNYLSDTTAVAQWIVNTYILTLNANGGIVNPTNINVTYNAAIGTLPTPTRTGFTFLGWKIEDITITQSTIWNYLTDTIAVAQWSLNVYLLLLDANGGTISPNSLQVSYGQPIGTIPTATKSGFTFNGWKIDEDIITAATIWLYTTNKTAVAQWVANTYTLTLNPTGGAVSPTSIQVTFGQNIGTIPNALRPGYMFGGWKLNDEFINSATVWNFTSNQTAVAQWSALSFTLSFNPNGSNGEANSKTVTYDEQVGELPNLTRVGYAFGGWKIDETIITETTVWKYNSNKTAVASWNLLAFTLSLNPNGGEVTPTSIPVIYEHLIGELPNPTKTGYSFTNWKIGNTIITQDSIWLYLSDQTAVAQWVANSYTLTLNPNGGSVSTSTITVNYNSAIGFIPTPIKMGNDFEGWFIEEEEINQNTNWEHLEDKIADAKWAIQTFIISASANSEFGTISPDGDYVANYGETVKFTMLPVGQYSRLDSVVVNNINFGALNEYTFTNISENSTIAAYFSSSISINEQNYSTINIYSFNNQIFIKNNDNIPIQKIEVFDMLGKLIYQNNKIESPISFDVNQGIYFVKLLGNQHQIAKKIYLNCK